MTASISIGLVFLVLQTAILIAVMLSETKVGMKIIDKTDLF